MAFPVYPSNVTPGLPTGIPVTMAQTTAYALPARACVVQATASCEVSPDGSNGWQTISAITQGTTLGGGFVRCSGSTAIIMCRPM